MITKLLGNKIQKLINENLDNIIEASGATNATSGKGYGFLVEKHVIDLLRKKLGKIIILNENSDRNNFADFYLDNERNPINVKFGASTILGTPNTVSGDRLMKRLESNQIDGYWLLKIRKVNGKYTVSFFDLFDYMPCIKFVKTGQILFNERRFYTTPTQINKMTLEEKKNSLRLVLIDGTKKIIAKWEEFAQNVNN